MTATLWIAFGFLALLVVFLIVTVFIRDRFSPTQVNILRFLTALCAGFAGGFFTGDALFKVDTTLANGTKLAISGTAGFALFLTVWFTYKPVFGLTPGFNFKVLKDWTFEQTVLAMMEADNGLSKFIGFTKQELSLPLAERELNEDSALEALKKLRYLNSELPNYSVLLDSNVYQIKKID